MASRSEKFARKPSSEKKDETPKIPEAEEEVIKFSPEEEATLLAESNDKKASANELFGKASFQDALDTYDAAAAACPNYLDYELAVLKSNISACHLKLEDWKEAVKAASAALDGLDRLRRKDEDGRLGVKEGGEEIEEIVSEGAAKAEDTSDRGKREADVERIRAKALMRRARARSEIGGWATLQGAEDGKGFPSFLEMVCGTKLM
ncbi:hypothetical protein LARI1_G008863 [Lachnellula arida]|uniref:Tetratricopeptide repeat protein 1 n=1 Tax=Lachnellula arida TaxID=1316785 RepID=A0A8T9B307_9HELO|nr:hypothetical protein LARI1_G008863 [Lachnellula arida]